MCASQGLWYRSAEVRKSWAPCLFCSPFLYSDSAWRIDSEMVASTWYPADLNSHKRAHLVSSAIGPATVALACFPSAAGMLQCRFVFMNFLACVWYYVATIEGLGNSWLTSVGEASRSTMLSLLVVSSDKFLVRLKS